MRPSGFLGPVRFVVSLLAIAAVALSPAKTLAADQSTIAAAKKEGQVVWYNGLSGERFGAAEALRIDLAHEVVPAEQLDEKVAEVVDALLHGAPGAQRTLKDGMERFVAPTVEAIGATRSSHGSPRAPEAQEGIASFKEERKPSWYPQ